MNGTVSRMTSSANDDADDGGATIRLARGFTQVPNGVVAADITATSFRVYVAILSYGRGAEPTAFPKRETVCEQFNISPRSFSAAIKELQDRGFLVISKRSYAGGMRRSNVYFFPDVDDAPSRGANIAPGQLPESAPSAGTLFASPEEEDSFKKTDLKKTRATALPRDFAPTEASSSWAKKNFPRVDVSRETESFVLYYQGHGDKKFTDWQAAWKSWIRKSTQYNPTPIRPTAVQPTTELDPYGDPRWA